MTETTFKQYKYFISFCYRNNNNHQGFGNGTFVLNKKISDNKDIKEITDHIKGEIKTDEIVILGITLLDYLNGCTRC